MLLQVRDPVGALDELQAVIVNLSCLINHSVICSYCLVIRLSWVFNRRARHLAPSLNIIVYPCGVSVQFSLDNVMISIKLLLPLLTC